MVVDFLAQGNIEMHLVGLDPDTPWSQMQCIKTTQPFRSLEFLEFLKVKWLLNGMK